MDLTYASRKTWDGIWRFMVGRGGQEGRAKRALRRHAAMLVVSAVMSMFYGHWLLRAWPSIVVIVVTLRLVHYVTAWRFNRHVIDPAVSVLDPVIRKNSPSGRGLVHLAVPRDFRDKDGATIVVHLPMDWTPGRTDMANLVTLTGQRLSADNLTATWTLSGRRPHVAMSTPAKPPSAVDMADMMAAADTAPEDAVIMGAGTRGQVVTFDLAMESPHLLINGGSGAGKSELLAWIVGQFMRRGYGVLCLDSKFVSHMWLRRIPGVLYAAEDEELHEALLWLDGELLRRARFVSAGGDPATLVPLVAVLEEMNGASNRLRAYWKAIGGKGMSPALTALANLANMGREMRVHILLAGQSVTAKSTGGPEGRESFGGRVLGRASANAWKMLAPQIKPAPVKRGEPGRWHIVVGDVLKEFQAPFCNIKNESAKLIEWATGGKPVPDVPAMMLGAAQVVVDEHESMSSSGPTTCTLPEFADSRDIPLKRLENWRSQYRETFPPAAGKRGKALAYDPADLDLFVLTRSQA